MLLVTLFLQIALADIFYVLALGAARLYRLPETEMTYGAYFRRIFHLAKPYMFRIRAEQRHRAFALSRLRCSYLFYQSIAGAGAMAPLIVAEPSPALFLTAWLTANLLAAMCLTDIKTQYLPDAFMFPAIALSLIAACGGAYLPVTDALIGGAAGFSMMWGINALFRLIRKKNGMGAGDFTLTGLLGLWTGAFALPYILFLSSFIGLAGAIGAALIRREKVARRFAYGPALTAAGWGIFLYQLAVFA